MFKKLSILVIPLIVFFNTAFAFGKISNLDAIYGQDNRRFVDQFSSPKIKNLSESVALIISKDSIIKNLFFSSVSAKLLSDTDGINLCIDEKYSNHHTLNSCTGFLIGENLLASAGHCFMNSSDCENKLIAFNVRVKNETSSGYSVLNKNIYECSEIVTSVFDSSGIQDYSVIRLNKKVTGIMPLKLRNVGSLQETDKVFMIGHPMGLPLVATRAARISDLTMPHSFKASLDSFEGNSGSPVFNSETMEVEGILVRGEEDFLLDQTDKCYRYAKYEQNGIDPTSLKGEGVNRILDINSFINH